MKALLIALVLLATGAPPLPAEVTLDAFAAGSGGAVGETNPQCQLLAGEASASHAGRVNVTLHTGIFANLFGLVAAPLRIEVRGDEVYVFVTGTAVRTFQWTSDFSAWNGILSLNVDPATGWPFVKVKLAAAREVFWRHR